MAAGNFHRFSDITDPRTTPRVGKESVQESILLYAMQEAMISLRDVYVEPGGECVYHVTMIYN